jgi:hypothetical protein
VNVFIAVKIQVDLLTAQISHAINLS